MATSLLLETDALLKQANEASTNPELEFLWLELTNQCNLKCIHCYAESGPKETMNDLLSRQDYEKLIADASELGCKQIQFIGGEPTLNKDLKYLISFASCMGYESIEVYTNLVSLPESLIECFTLYNVKVATSVYADNSELHDEITQIQGSFVHTIKNIERLLDQRIEVRAGVIYKEGMYEQAVSTAEFLKNIGLENVGLDRMRLFGRGKETVEEEALTELCGACSENIICVGPDGRVAPCIMSKKWAVGSVLDTSLSEILHSKKLNILRREIYSATNHQSHTTAGIHMGGCNPDRPNTCQPDKGSTCNPCNPNRHCGPNDCRPRK